LLYVILPPKPPGLSKPFPLQRALDNRSPRQPNQYKNLFVFIIDDITTEAEAVSILIFLDFMHDIAKIAVMGVLADNRAEPVWRNRFCFRTTRIVNANQ
jgi:hypothetical protein